MADKTKAEFDAALADLVRELAAVPPPPPPATGDTTQRDLFMLLADETMVDARVDHAAAFSPDRRAGRTTGRPASRRLRRVAGGASDFRRHVDDGNAVKYARPTRSEWIFFAAAGVIGALAAVVLYLGWRAFRSPNVEPPIVVDVTRTTSAATVTPIAAAVPEAAPVAAVEVKSVVGGAGIASQVPRAEPKRVTRNKTAKKYRHAGWDNPY